MPARAAGSFDKSRPSSVIVPLKETKPVSASISVVLPAPFGPISATSSPSWIARSTSLTAWTPPYWTDRPSTSRTIGRLRSSDSGTLGREAWSRTGAAACSRGGWTSGRLCVIRYSLPATPSGFCSSVRISITPPNRRNQFPFRPNHLSSAYGNSACVEITPAKTAPEISEMPPA